MPGAIALCPGRLLFDRLQERLAGKQQLLPVNAAPCMAVCDRPVTVAFQALDAWSYVVAGVDADRDVDQVIAAALAIASSEHGIPAMADRPPFFRSGVVSRVPPLV